MSSLRPRFSPELISNYVIRLTLTLLSLVGFLTVASAQHSSAKGTPAESTPGQSTPSTYARDKVETVNLANGNFSLSIPLATVGGRGSAGFTIALSYDSKVWTAQHDRDFLPNGPIHDLYTAMYEKLEEFEPGLAKLGGGWTIRTAPGIKALTFGIDPAPSTWREFEVDGIPGCGFKDVLTKMWLTLPDGSQIELRDSLTQGAPALATRHVADLCGQIQSKMEMAGSGSKLSSQNNNVGDTHEGGWPLFGRWLKESVRLYQTTAIFAGVDQGPS